MQKILHTKDVRESVTVMKKKVFIIAEVGVNHNGSVDNAIQMIDVACEAGVDAVKFQTFKAELLVTGTLEKEAYQLEYSGDSETQFDMLKKYELSEEATIRLKGYALQKGLEFISTPYDMESADFLESIDVKRFKIGAGEINDLPFLDYVARKGKPIILSTGASFLDEVKEAVSVIERHNTSLSLLHCTSSYPSPMSDVNLNAMKTMMEEFSYPIGYSDHTTGLTASIAAVAIGASIIERHFTLDKNMDGPDHKASLCPQELKQLVVCIREVETLLGSSDKRPCPSESETISMGRRSLFSACDISKGATVRKEMLITKRPGTGMAPKMYWELLGKTTKLEIKADTMLVPDYFEG